MMAGGLELDVAVRIERALEAALLAAQATGCPPRLAAALRHAVFPGGARVRPRLCLAVAMASGADDQTLADAAATSIELLHCASLVHDDLPCFDDAALRRGLPSVHRAFGEKLAVLAGDALIAMAFETLAHGFAHAPARLAVVLLNVGRAASAPSGIAAGQAWECEPQVPLLDYQRAKTGALFTAATICGAAAAGADGERWRALGERLGEAYQLADDIRDVLADTAELGKPAGRDADLGRPNAVAEFGMDGAIQRFRRSVIAAAEAMPPCDGAPQLRVLIQREAVRLLPEKLVRRAA
jgi:geranylgeranyl diphosphate synthase, type II